MAAAQGTSVHCVERGEAIARDGSDEVSDPQAVPGQRAASAGARARQTMSRGAVEAAGLSSPGCAAEKGGIFDPQGARSLVACTGAATSEGCLQSTLHRWEVLIRSISAQACRQLPRPCMLAPLIAYASSGPAAASPGGLLHVVPDSLHPRDSQWSYSVDWWSELSLPLMVS